jgi:hypothetical protein
LIKKAEKCPINKARCSVELLSSSPCDFTSRINDNNAKKPKIKKVQKAVELLF